MNVNYDYAGARVLVTGAGTGIGKGIALAFGQAGAKVALHYSRSRDGADAAVEEIRASGGTAEAFGANFDDVEVVQALRCEAVDWLGGIDVLKTSPPPRIVRFPLERAFLPHFMHKTCGRQ